MNPNQYQRPQVLPSSINIKEAEKIVEKLGIQKSLERRYARLDEVQSIWKPSEVKECCIKNSGMFSHLKTKDAKEVNEIEGKPKSITFEKFLNNVLPTAEKIEYYTDKIDDSFGALVTAVHEDSPPILQWDFKDNRNQVSHYLHCNGSSPITWCLKRHSYINVTAICLMPHMWFDNNSCNQSKGGILILDGAKDSICEKVGNALFPEILKSELRDIRSTVEAYSQNAKIGSNEDSACGVIMQTSSDWNYKVRVTSDGMKFIYLIDRYE